MSVQQDWLALFHGSCTGLDQHGRFVVGSGSVREGIMSNDNDDPTLAAALSLTPIDHPNQYFGGRAVSQSGAESIIESFVGGVPCLFHTPDGDVVFSVEELKIDDGQLMARVAASAREDMQRVTSFLTEDIEPAVRMDLRVAPDPQTGGMPDKLDMAVLVKVHVDLLARH